jgi:Flp pilus assembly protein TadG
MKMICKSPFVKKLVSDQSGQVLVWVTLGFMSLIAVAGLVIDGGQAYADHAILQNSANSAALAAAGVVYNSDTTTGAVSTGTTFSGSSGDNNANTNMPGAGTVSTTITPVCLNLLMPTGQTCAGNGNIANAVHAFQTNTVNTFFMRFFGVKKLTIKAEATASMQGLAQPWNVAIIVDSTGSMNTGDANCGNGVTEFQCALTGVQTLLQTTNPACPAGSPNCPTGASFAVSLFTFPNVLTSVNGSLPVVNGTTIDSLSQDINCNGTPGYFSNWKTEPLAAPYTLPVPGATLPVDSEGRTYLTYKQTSTGTLWTATYQITPFLSDYYDPTSTSTGGLNSSSQLVKAVGYGTTKGCLTYTFGIDGAGGTGSNFGNTYFASSIYAAQSALTAQSAGNSNVQNAIIFLSDGQANASYYSKNSGAYGTVSDSLSGGNQFNWANEFPEGAGVGTTTTSEVGPTSVGYPVPAYLTPATSTSSAIAYSTLTGTGLYPDWKDQCQQAMTAAQYAASHGTRVYAVAYGPEASGCYNGWSVGATDTTLTATGTNQPFSSVSQVLPCTTMENIASAWDYFYSDNQQQGNVNLGCTDNNHTTVSLKDIFLSIAGSFTKPRLLPNTAT